jgi:hypothetical protein
VNALYLENISCDFEDLRKTKASNTAADGNHFHCADAESQRGEPEARNL